MFLTVSDDAAFECFNTFINTNPERMLMLGILGQAFRDLITIGEMPENRTRAIKWFEDPSAEYIFSYQSIKLHLTISGRELRKIEATLQHAIKEDLIFRRRLN